VADQSAISPFLGGIGIICIAFIYEYRISVVYIGISILASYASRPTQSVMYVPVQVNRFVESILLIVQYRYLKSCSGDICSPESDSPHKFMRYWFYYSIWLGFSFPPDTLCQVETICSGGVPVSKRHFGGAGP